jgi:E3 ubiquitin-protein ligase SIAH1
VANWLRSIRFSCKNYEFGCPSFLPRRELEADHERSCPYAPVFCPVRRCDFIGGPRDHLQRHITARHGWSVDGFRYGEPFRVRIYPAVRSVLRADDGELFHFRAEMERGGRIELSMIRIRPDDAVAAEFTYEVKTPAAAGLQHRLHMQSTVWATSLRHGPADVNPVSVTVPDDMFPLEGPESDSVEVCVRKVAPAAARDE